MTRATIDLAIDDTHRLSILIDDDGHADPVMAGDPDDDQYRRDLLELVGIVADSATTLMLRVLKAEAAYDRRRARELAVNGPGELSPDRRTLTFTAEAAADG